MRTTVKQTGRRTTIEMKAGKGEDLRGIAEAMVNATPETGNRIGDWMQTYTGRAFWPLDPRVDEIYIDDIAHSLSMQCRYAGHCLRFYSVAEHSVWCALMVMMPHTDFVFCKNLSAAVYQARMQDYSTRDAATNTLALAALLHDAAEAYLVDLPRPVKRSMPEYHRAEARVERAIAQRFDIPYPMPPEVKEADERMLATEAATLMAPPPAKWTLNGEPYHIRAELLGVDPSSACGAFRELYRLLVGRRGED